MADDLSNDDPDQTEDGPDNSASHRGRHPHLEHGEPRSRWVRTQAEDQANHSPENANSR